ncbi:CMRF35-like molecule 8 isoform X2 [Pleuronectes platessa]|uniref:CMRF35-like molecule 8 isoform X2 n=1 Tax=Pleuronectes platessa TaxID=8262 RepID=UPI00232A62E9|nr:CMRF35-like molecule 8 isoform X2 [Pleuronectes platessa]
MKPALRSEKEKGQRRKSSMDKVFLILILAGGFWKTEAVTVEGELGGDVTITCSHINAHSNVKYFCKAPCNNEDVLIKSNEISKGRYSITNEGNTFYVTISRLTESDAGTYQCRIERVGWDTYEEVILKVVKGKTKDPEDDFSQSTRGEAFTTTATRPASTTTATRPASTTTAIPAVSDSNNSHAGEQNTGSDFVLYATVGSVATLSVSLLLATRFRKRRDDVSAEEGEIDSENDDIAKEVRSMMRLSEKNSGAHRPKQDPSTSVYTEVEYSSPPHISETICCSRGVTDSRHSAANVLSTSSEICSICIPPMISKREGDGRLRKHTEAPAALRNALIKATDSCLSTVSVVYYRTCSDSTESKPCSLWFGLDLSE